MNTIKQFYLPMRQTFITIIICLVILTGVNLVYSSGPPPGATPPECPSGYPGCDAPINVSGSTQIFLDSKILNVKTDSSGMLTISGALKSSTLRSNYDTYLATLGGNVGIGTTNPGTKLHISGTNNQLRL
ncbi:hypothetical protein KKG15_01510, partial [Patescibacteria group bacterium]|nr:hypothetical protein [Patescibacteria group bacterium]